MQTPAVLPAEAQENDRWPEPGAEGDDNVRHPCHNADTPPAEGPCRDRPECRRDSGGTAGGDVPYGTVHRFPEDAERRGDSE